ncbi:unnamed protein product [Caenorhabditis angaria]|uniref:Uncharacterized protein n=1 Tax=Caenorhabditis angaria TaxID=860376 RepID=A0A9P1IPT8_9PELO|nr:unnamed protein product [Caenorhabditis angaria]
MAISNQDELNSYLAGVISLIANCALLIATSKTLQYVSKFKYLYIVKGGIQLPFLFGQFLLILFLIFVVISCLYPTIQYIQVAQLLKSSGISQDRMAIITNLIIVSIAIPTAILVTIGYIPSDYDLKISLNIVYYINGEGDAAFLIAPMNAYSITSGAYRIDFSSLICTIFILTVLLLAVIIVIISRFQIEFLMKAKLQSVNSLKAQKQLNRVLLLQFALPFLTIHIPFYICFILPFIDLENATMSNYLPFLFSWCPAINPILIIFSVRSIRDRFKWKQSGSMSNSSTNNHQVFQIRRNTNIE